MENYFNELNTIDVSNKTERKNGLTYLSWAWAWGEVKKNHPDAQYKVYENEQGWNYFTDGRTCWVKVSVTINAIEHIEYLPVMDFRNASIPVEKVTSFDVNKAIQRAITKACARHGLGLYIYAGEDLPEDSESENGGTEKGGNKDAGKGQKGKNSHPIPTISQKEALKKIKRTIADVAKYFGIDENAVTADHVDDYIREVVAYQKKKAAEKEAALEAEAQQVFSQGTDNDESSMTHSVADDAPN